MKREIKFRVWCNNKGNWEKDLIAILPSGALLHHQGYSQYKPCSIDTHIIQQSTGLLDKNGKDIYEGDIVVITIKENIGTFNVPDDIIANGGYTGRQDIYEGEVVYNLDLTSFGVEDKESGFIQFTKIENTFFEVIGNIYESKHLLEVNNVKD